jgi:hypothetical protein
MGEFGCVFTLGCAANEACIETLEALGTEVTGLCRSGVANTAGNGLRALSPVSSNLSLVRLDELSRLMRLTSIDYRTDGKQGVVATLLGSTYAWGFDRIANPAQDPALSSTYVRMILSLYRLA